MAHFAEIDDENKVVRVLVVDNKYEEIGADFLAIELGLGGRWIQTSYNNNFRKQFAGIDFVYDEVNDVFIAPQPFPSWSLDENFDWQAPIAKPNDDFWIWNEEKQEWVNGQTL